MINLDQMPSAPIDFDKMQDVGLGGGQSARDREIRRRLTGQVDDNKKRIAKIDSMQKNGRQKTR